FDGYGKLRGGRKPGSAQVRRLTDDITATVRTHGRRSEGNGSDSGERGGSAAHGSDKCARSERNRVQVRPRSQRLEEDTACQRTSCCQPSRQMGSRRSRTIQPGYAKSTARSSSSARP